MYHPCNLIGLINIRAISDVKSDLNLKITHFKVKCLAYISNCQISLSKMTRLDRVMPEVAFEEDEVESKLQLRTSELQ